MPGGNSCAFRSCCTRAGHGISMFSFPNDNEQAELWLKACYRDDLLPKAGAGTLHKSYYKLCELHFEEKFISKGNSKKRLFPNAIPSIFPEKMVEKMPEESALEDNEISLIPETREKIHILSDVIIGPMKDTLPSNIPVLVDIPDPSTSKPAICHTESLQNISTEMENSQIQGMPEPLLSPTASTQTTLDLTANTPRKRKLKAEIRSLRRRSSSKTEDIKTEDIICSVDDFKTMCEMYLDEPLRGIIKSHVTLKNKKRISHRYPVEIKQLALTLYFLSPRAYMSLCNMLTLPTKRSLQRMTENISCRPGLDNNAIFKALEFKAKAMLEQEKHCILCIDELSLKCNLFYDISKDELVGFEDIGNGKKNSSLCKNALVIMARGLYSKWKQPLAYFFVGSQLKASDLEPIIEECVLKLASIGLIVDAISSDMGTNFLKLAKLFNVTPENSDFQIENHTLLYIFDPCHLIKATRNNLKKHTFEFEGKKTSWEFIRSFYEQDRKQFYRCASKLTNAHISPSPFEKMKVKYAVQVLSHSVVCGMNTHMSFGALPAEAFATVQVVERFNDLFDILNSTSLKHPYKYKNVFDGSKFQIDFLNDNLKFLSDLKIIDPSKNEDITNKMNLKKCWMITINSVMKLWDKLSKQNFKFLKTRNINTDCLENFFGHIRQQGGNCTNPTPIQFSRAFKKLYWQNYLHSENMNCENDFNEVLLDVKSTNINEIFETSQKPIPAVAVSGSSYTKESLPTQNAFTYVCGYLLKKSLNVHNNCDLCEIYMKNCESLDVNSLLIHYKAYNTQKNIHGSLHDPPELFIKYIYDLENVFKSRFEDISKRQGISHKLLNIMENIAFSHPCPSFPKIYVLKLFIRLKTV